MEGKGYYVFFAVGFLSGLYVVNLVFPHKKEKHDVKIEHIENSLYFKPKNPVSQHPNTYTNTNINDNINNNNLPQQTQNQIATPQIPQTSQTVNSRSPYASLFTTNQNKKI